MSLEGFAHVFGDHINTDYIISGKHKAGFTDVKEMTKFLMEDIRPGFYNEIQPGDFITHLDGEPVLGGDRAELGAGELLFGSDGGKGDEDEQPGGHAEAGDECPEAVALREAREETGLEDLAHHDVVDLVGGDVVEVAPPYDHAELTALAAANIAYEYLGLFARRVT